MTRTTPGRRKTQTYTTGPFTPAKEPIYVAYDPTTDTAHVIERKPKLDWRRGTKRANKINAGRS